MEDLGCESADNWQLPSTSIFTIVIITQRVSRYSFYRPTEGGRLSRLRHYSRGAQPVPKAVYRSSCCDKHNRPRRDLNRVLSHRSQTVRRASHSATATCRPMFQRRRNGGGEGGAGPHNVETTGARVSFSPRNIFPHFCMQFLKLPLFVVML